MFSPEVGRGLAFVGFVQPASGGILSMSEMQARWFAELCKESVSLPSKADMEADIKKEQVRIFDFFRHFFCHIAAEVISFCPGSDISTCPLALASEFLKKWLFGKYILVSTFTKGQAILYEQSTHFYIENVAQIPRNMKQCKRMLFKSIINNCK